MLKQALDVLRKAEAEADQVVAAAKRKAADIRKKAEEDGAYVLHKATAEAELEATATAMRYESEADSIKAEAAKSAAHEAAALAKMASQNRMKALNRAVERVVRRNGHR